jgi:hypothetical protein
MTTPPDYQQQLATYLGAWRQLFEALTTLATATPLPGIPPGYAAAPMAPPPMGMPGSPVGMPGPADHTQQLFGYLQAWRQYLEQAAEQTGAAPAPHAGAPKRPHVPVPPQDPDVGRSQHHDDSSGHRSPKRTPTAPVAPRNESGSQVPADALRAPTDRRAMIPRPPALETGTQVVPLLTGRETGSMAPTVDRLFRGLQDRTRGSE